MRRAAAVLGLLLAAACTPRMEPPGETMREPALLHDVAVMPDGFRLPLHRWKSTAEPPEMVVLAVHGFNDYGAFFAGPGSWLQARGIAAYAYDQRGFGATATAGRWPGSAALVADLRTMVGLVRAQYPDLPLFLLGESMGGAVAMTALTQEPPLPVDGTILVAPAVWGRATMPWYQRWLLEAVAHTLPWLKVSGRGLGIMPSDNLPMLRQLGADPLVIKNTRADAVWGIVNLMDRALAAAPRFDARALILYGEKDEIIPRKPTRRMLDSLPPVPEGRRSIAVYPEGYHMLLRDVAAETYWRDILYWMRDPQAPLLSEADRRDWRRALGE